jgi:hypothetical protein
MQPYYMLRYKSQNRAERPCFLQGRALRNVQKYIEKFVIFSKIVLDKHTEQWYHNRARVGTFCACTAMMQEIASKKR